MRKTLIITFCTILSFAAFGQKQNAFKLNLLSPILKIVNVQYERAVNEKSTAQLGFYYINTSIFDSDTRFKGFGITPEYRLYPSGSVIDGFFVAPFMRYQGMELSATVDDGQGPQEVSANTSFIGGGVIVGRQWLFGEMITFEAFIGPSYSVAGDLKLSAGADEEDFDVSVLDGFGLRFGITLGFAF